MTIKAFSPVATILALTSFPVLAEQAVLNLNDFTYGAELTPAESEFRRFTLTPSMINDIQRRDLGDVRVFDVNNELMPSMVRKMEADIKTSKQTLKVYRYRVAGETKGYILDRTANHENSLKSLLLKWKRGDAPSVLSMSIEHSADKKSWKTIKDVATISNFKFGKGMLRQNLIQINEHTQQYIRLRFYDTNNAPALASVTAYSTNRKLLEDAWVSGGKLASVKKLPNTYRFSVSEGVSPKFIKLSFGKLNSMMSGALYTLTDVDGKLQPKLAIKDFDAYVFSRNNKVVKSNPIDIRKWQSSDWQIKATAKINFSDDDLPGVTVAYPHYEVIFSNDGEAPYTVVWGNNSIAKSSTRDFMERIKASNLSWEDITVVNSGGILNNVELEELMESRQTSWLMVIIGLFVFAIITAAGMLAYRRYQST